MFSRLVKLPEKPEESFWNSSSYLKSIWISIWTLPTKFPLPRLVLHFWGAMIENIYGPPIFCLPSRPPPPSHATHWLTCLCVLPPPPHKSCHYLDSQITALPSRPFPNDSGHCILLRAYIADFVRVDGWGKSRRVMEGEDNQCRPDTLLPHLSLLTLVLSFSFLFQATISIGARVKTSFVPSCPSPWISLKVGVIYTYWSL